MQPSGREQEENCSILDSTVLRQTDIFGIDATISNVVDFSYRRENISDLDELLGAQRDLPTRDGTIRFVTAVRLAYSSVHFGCVRQSSWSKMGK